MIMTNDKFGRLELLMESLYKFVNGDLTEERALDFASDSVSLFSAKDLNKIVGDFKTLYNTGKNITIEKETV